MPRKSGKGGIVKLNTQQKGWIAGTIVTALGMLVGIWLGSSPITREMWHSVWAAYAVLFCGLAAIGGTIVATAVTRPEKAPPTDTTSEAGA